MNTKSLSPYLIAPIVALSTFGCSSDPSAPSGRVDEPLADIEQYLGNSLPLLGTSTGTNVTAGGNFAYAYHSGGSSTPSEFDSDGVNTTVGQTIANEAASASVTAATATVSSSSTVIGGSGSCGSFTASGSSAMIAMASAQTLTTQGPWGPYASYGGGAAGNEGFVVLGLDCTTQSGLPAIASGTVFVTGLPVSDTDTFVGFAGVGGSSVWVNCPAGPTSCTTVTVQQTVSPCPPDGGSRWGTGESFDSGSGGSTGESSSSGSGGSTGESSSSSSGSGGSTGESSSSSSGSGGSTGVTTSAGGGVGGLCTFTQQTTTYGAAGAAVSFSFLTSVGATIGLGTGVNGTGAASDGHPGSAGVNSTTSASLAVYLLE